MTEDEFRSAIAREAMEWIGTPYHANGGVKGAGSNCAMFLFRVGQNAGAIPAEAPHPRWFTPQLATHSKEERLIAYLEAYGAKEIYESEVKTGDVILYKSGMAHGHAALVLEWPRIIHIMPIHGCQMGNVDDGKLGAFSRRYFTLWKAS